MIEKLLVETTRDTTALKDSLSLSAGSAIALRDSTPEAYEQVSNLSLQRSSKRAETETAAKR
jgi:hypothetical protein